MILFWLCNWLIANDNMQLSVYIAHVFISRHTNEDAFKHSKHNHGSLKLLRKIKYA